MICLVRRKLITTLCLARVLESKFVASIKILRNCLLSLCRNCSLSELSTQAALRVSVCEITATLVELCHYSRPTIGHDATR